MPAYLPSLSLAGVKVVNVHPGNPARGLLTVMTLTVILDIATGVPVAILNATKLTDMRTGAAGSVAAKYLSCKKEIVLGLIGTGRLAEAQYQAISQELDICEIRCWSRNSLHAEKFAQAITDHDASSVPVERACDCDLLVTTPPPDSLLSGANGCRKEPTSMRLALMRRVNRNPIPFCSNAGRSLSTIYLRPFTPGR